MIRLCFEQAHGDFRWAVHDGEAWHLVKGIRTEVDLETRDDDAPDQDEPSGWLEPTEPARLVIQDGYAHVLRDLTRPT